MNQVLLETIVEKLEGLEISLLKENKTGNKETIQTDLLKEIKLFQSEIAKFPSHLKQSNEKMNELSKNIDAVNFKLEKGVSEQINHKHHLHKGIWISIGLFLTSLILLYGWINSYSTKKAVEANDIKYRYLKVIGNVTLLSLLYQSDSLYNLNNDLFSKWVLDREESLGHQAERQRLVGEKHRGKDDEKLQLIK